MHLKTLSIPLLALTALVLGGCGSPDSKITVASTAASLVAKHPESLVIKVTGGAEKSSDSASQVSNPDYAAALTKALQQAGLFGTIIPAGQTGADYQLEVTLAALQPPSIGAAMTATVEANWKLTRVSNGFTIWQKAISASHTTQAKEAFTGIERVRLAIEGAVQDNVQEGIAQLSTVSPP